MSLKRDLRAAYYDLLSVLGIIIGKKPLCGPRILQLNICDECNLDCIMCNRSCINPGGFLDFNKIMSTIGEVYPLGLREIYYHGFGEPFLHPRISDIFYTVHKKYPYLKQYVITNATCISDEMRKSIMTNKVGLRCSVHAASQKKWGEIHPYDDISLFVKMKQTINRLAKADPDKVTVLFVLFKTNFKTIDSMVKFALDTGVINVQFRPMTFYKDKDGKIMNKHLTLEKEEYDQVVEELIEYKKTYRKKLNIDMIPFCLSRYDDKLRRSCSFGYFKQKNSCFISWVLSVITEDGDILPGCVEDAYPKIAGNIYKDKFKDVWWSKTLDEFRRKQLFKNMNDYTPSDCLGWCQHLNTNRKLNDIKKLRFFSRL